MTTAPASHTSPRRCRCVRCRAAISVVSPSGVSMRACRSTALPRRRIGQVRAHVGGIKADGRAIAGHARKPGRRSGAARGPGRQVPPANRGAWPFGSMLRETRKIDDSIPSAISGRMIFSQVTSAGIGVVVRAMAQATPARRQSWICRMPTAARLPCGSTTNRQVILRSFITASAFSASASRPDGAGRGCHHLVGGQRQQPVHVPPQVAVGHDPDQVTIRHRSRQPRRSPSG